MTINTDYEQVRVLARDMGVLCQHMHIEANELESELTRLKKTLGDDGIERIEACLSDILDKLGEDRQALLALAKHMTAYADGLEQTK